MTDEQEKKFLMEHQIIKEALFGKEELGQIGLVKENHMMFEFFSGAMWTVHAAKWTVGALALIGTIAGTIWHFVRSPIK